MSIAGTGAVNFSDISNTLGGGRPISLSEYYRNSLPLYSYHLSSLPNSGSALSISSFRNGTRNSNMFLSVSATNHNSYLGGVYFQVTAKTNITIDRITPTFYANNGTVTLSNTIFFRKGPLTDANVLTDSAQWSNAGTSAAFSFNSQSNIEIPISIGLSLGANEVGSIYLACGPNTIAGGPYGFWTNGLTGGTTVDGTDLILQKGGYQSTNNTFSTFPISGNTGVDFCGSIMYVKHPLYAFTTHTFTNASATGRAGPTLAQCRTAYSTTSWVNNTSLFNMATPGIQVWTVPIKGNYMFTVAGAASGSFYNGNANGVVMTIANVNLNINDKIYIVVGQMGVTGGGGGASWVFLNSLSTASLMFVAGGGGGAGYNSYNYGYAAANPYGIAGQLSTAAASGYSGSYTGGAAGTNGGGGGGSQGYAGNGTAGGNNGSGGHASSITNVNCGGGGGGGSANITASSTFLGGAGNGPGGFGGGGGSAGNGTGWGLGGGGGGGYNGGGAGSGAIDLFSGGAGGGGGGSYYITNNGVFSSWAATNNNVGYVTITKE